MSVTRPNLAAAASKLRELHHQSQPLLLANAWDVASARMVEELGFPAVATSSSAIAAAFGQPDTDSMPLDVAFGTVARIAAALKIPVTADLEAGYQLAPAAFVERLLATGAVGCNLEDSDHHGDGVLIDPEAQAQRLSEVKKAAQAAGVDVVINARVDAYVRHLEDAEAETIRRGRAYLAAGADCVYPIFLADAKAIGAIVDGVGGPVNILLRPGVPSVEELRRLGVARISLGGGLFRLALNAAKQNAQALLDGTLYHQ